MSYLDTTNKLYGINLKRSKLTIAMSGVIVGDTVSGGAAWSSNDNVAFYVNEGKSEIAINCPVTFSNTAAASGAPVLVKQAYSSSDSKGIGQTSLNIYGNITTNSKGYIIDDAGGQASINYFGTMDEPAYWFVNKRAFKYELGLPYDGGDTTFVFGGTEWNAGTFSLLEKTIDITHTFQDYFDIIYGAGNTVVTASDTATETVLTVVMEHGNLLPIQFKHENTIGSVTTYGEAVPIKTANFVKTNF